MHKIQSIYIYIYSALHTCAQTRTKADSPVEKTARSTIKNQCTAMASSPRAEYVHRKSCQQTCSPYHRVSVSLFNNDTACSKMQKSKILFLNYTLSCKMVII